MPLLPLLLPSRNIAAARPIYCPNANEHLQTVSNARCLNIVRPVHKLDSLGTRTHTGVLRPSAVYASEVPPLSRHGVRRRMAAATRPARRGPGRSSLYVLKSPLPGHSWCVLCSGRCRDGELASSEPGSGMMAKAMKCACACKVARDGMKCVGCTMKGQP